MGHEFRISLCVKLCQLDVVEDVIWKFPLLANKKRNKERNYEPLEAYELLHRENLISSMSLTYELSVTYTVYSEKGMGDLRKAMEKTLKTPTSTYGLYICEPYTFLFGCNKKNVFIIDTHPVAEQFGGRKTALIVFSVMTSDGIHSICHWLWRRLYESGADKANKQTLSFIQLDK